MTKKKAIVFDVDGTLIPYGKKGIDTKNALFNNIKDDMNYIFDKANLKIDKAQQI